MASIIVERSTHLRELRLAWEDPSIRLIHIYGIAGAGKTTIARHLFTNGDAPYVELQCRSKMQVDLRSLIRRIESALLTSKQRKQFNKELQDALITAGYKQSPRSHIISLEGNSKIIAKGDVIVGDKIQQSDTQYYSELFDECRLRLEILTYILGPSQNPMCTIFMDSLEALDEAEDPICQWLSVHCLEHTNSDLLTIRVVATSRLRRSLMCPVEIGRSVWINEMSENEAHLLLQKHGVSDQKTREWMISITRAHPQALVLASRLPGIVKSEDLDLGLPLRSSEVYEELCTEILLRSILEREENKLLRRAMTTIPVLRFFTAEQISSMLHCSAEETERIVITLKEGGFIESTQNVFKYHDLLRELTLKFVNESRGYTFTRNLHLQAANSYSENSSGTNFLSIVEPFYHLLKADIEKAVNYSERYIKPALDKKERTLAAVLLSQIEFGSLPNNRFKGWLLLRHGGYYREFRNFSKAVQIFEKILAIVEEDQRLLASVLNNLGWVYLYWGGKKHIEQAIDYFKKSNEICMENHYDDISAMNMNNMGIGYARLGKLYNEEEFDCYKQCLTITENDQSRNHLVSGMAFQNMGLAFQKDHDYPQALNALIKALERYRSCRSPQREAEIVYLIACVYLDAKEYTKARDFLDISLKALHSRPDLDPYYLGENYFALARVLERLGENDSMRQCLLSMMTISLMEDAQYHVFAGQRTVQFNRYLFAMHGKEFAVKTLEYVAKQWSDSDIGQNVPQFSDFLSNAIQSFAESKFWSNGKSRVVHLPNLGSCKPTSWERVVLHTTEDSTLALCKICKKYSLSFHSNATQKVEILVAPELSR